MKFVIEKFYRYKYFSSNDLKIRVLLFQREYIDLLKEHEFLTQQRR